MYMVSLPLTNSLLNDLALPVSVSQRSFMVRLDATGAKMVRVLLILTESTLVTSLLNDGFGVLHDAKTKKDRKINVYFIFLYF